MKVVARTGRTHNPFDESHWVSRLRENLTSGSKGEGLETERRRPLAGHEGGNPGDRQGRALLASPRQSLTRQKCFDTWKNDFSQAKAWGKSSVAIGNQVRLAIITSVLVAVLVHQKMGRHGIVDDKALRKQDRRHHCVTDGTDRPDWTAPLFRFTSKVSRQVLRFFKHCFLESASQALYDSQLRPMLQAYL